MTLREYIDKLNQLAVSNPEYLNLPMVQSEISGEYLYEVNYPPLAGYLDNEEHFYEVGEDSFIEQGFTSANAIRVGF